MRRRLDVELVRRGLVSSRAEGTELIDAHRVTVGGALVTKASRLVSPSEAVEIEGPAREFVSRGGEKLAAALSAFPLTVNNRSVLDAGSSTGGFTDCLLQRGARRVAAFDVGRGQLHERLAADLRVVQRDRTNVRHLTASDLPFPCSMLVADLSFISLTVVLGALTACLTSEAGHPRPEAVVLVKPQFEVGRREVSRGGGIVTDGALHRQSVESVAACFVSLGWQVMGVIESPVRGAEGNVEFLLWASVTVDSSSVGQNLPVETDGTVGPPGAWR